MTIHSISRENAEHYVWGEVCDGWRLAKDAKLSVIEEQRSAVRPVPTFVGNPHGPALNCCSNAPWTIVSAAPQSGILSPMPSGSETHRPVLDANWMRK
jgi:hypothetical protein